MVELTFSNPSYLWVLAIVPVLVIIHFFTLRQSKAAIIKFSNFEAIERVSKGEFLGSPYKGLMKNKNVGLLLLRALIYLLLILSVAGTILIYQGQTSAIDYVFAIDASSSMLADDFTPTRLDAAKEAALSFVDVAPSGANVGLVTFASTSLIELRPTSKKEDIIGAIEKIDFHTSGGTAVGDALITSTNLFNQNKSRAIILLTDGQSNVGVPTEVALEYVKQNHVVVHTIGVATKEGGNISNLNLISRLDEEFLMQIADDTGGKFFKADSAEALNSAFKEIAATTEKLLTSNISWILLIAAVVLLGIEWILVNTIYKTIP